MRRGRVGLRNVKVDCKRESQKVQAGATKADADIVEIGLS